MGFRYVFIPLSVLDSTLLLDFQDFLCEDIA